MQNLTVNIEGTNLQIKEFNGQRVVTFKDIDTTHERPEGTARKRFNDNKKRFIEGVDYYELNQPDEIRTLGIERPQGGTPQKVVLVTESGYLMIAKSLTDDLSWAVQRKLVDNYFRFKEQATQSKPKRKRLKPKDLAVKQHMNIAEIMIEKIGLDPGIAYSVAIDEAEKESGCNLLAYEKLLPAADHPTGMYNATDLGKKVRPDSPVSPRAINKTLKALGLQVKEKDWVITEAGKEYGEMMPYTASFDNGSSHSDYRPLWNEKAVELLKEYYKEEGDK
ncbi:ORF6N domain-containing protein [Eubacterium limosum]|uniref:ORF6N domain-containing protein n=1 Tax=Eubacterium limosum TaxID=1736 RepID=UPI001D09906C|nr:ORF6N domain-containing protein [Eubacterium limosum]MCB6572107.1 ORF6N domain-containing protein [Eubacterium limosum]